MNVILIRHAEAGERDPALYPDDDLRPLTTDGRRKHADVVRAMKKMGIKIDAIVTSPLVRAAQTAEITADGYGFTDVTPTSDALGHNCTPVTVIKLLAKFPADHRVALVGHEPDLSAVAAAFISPSGDSRIELKKSGVIGISFEGMPALGMGVLRYHLKPGHVRKLG